MQSTSTRTPHPTRQVGAAGRRGLDLDELCRLAAQQMLAVALEAERRAYLDAHAAERDDDGRRLLVGNGYHQSREITTAAGRVEVTVAAEDRRDGHRFTSAILPPYMRCSPKVTEGCRCCICGGCPRMTPRPRWKDSSGPPRECQSRRSSG